MRYFLILVLSLCSSIIHAQTSTEEALILNQELEFLEESVKDIDIASSKSSESNEKNRDLTNSNLEKMYFSDSEDENAVSSRASAPKRRGL
jgi:hypothetical protein